MTTYFEDMTVGDTDEFGSYDVTEQEVREFAGQYDPQPFHTDPEAAKESMFGELVASGLPTLCLSVRLFVTEFVGDDGLGRFVLGFGRDQEGAVYVLTTDESGGGGSTGAVARLVAP